ncbi:TIGR04255 family protein [Prevotella sp. A2931]|uniref:TIGR04255 family protein n=1 Tax=Prevotella illustrans TaxID=2800387 RepID=A0ABS3M2F6_9BACT|nr:MULTISPECIES: TIGR04255 family protein [Prevotella]MBO1362322.1 TIGR04255 family protein [Prevotella illustrans]PTL26431.1 hypothetical protein C3V39_04825 [Prevotella sp. oral taxon 820]
MASDNHIVTKQWSKLEKAPVVVAMCQIKFDESNVAIDDFLRFDANLRRYLPERNHNIAASISLKTNTPIPLGKAPIKGISDTKVTGYLYFSKDQKEKLEISTDGITYTSEAAYMGWDNFKTTVLKYTELFKPILETVAIKRTSIRFINQFEITEFDDPAEYFNTVISSTGDERHLPYPLLKYGFRMTVDVKEGVYSIINQNVDKKTDKYTYIFDIDVLNRNNLLYTSDSLECVLEDLRNIKNTIFFNNITDKTIALCN